MKTRILGLLAVGLLAGPMAAHAAIVGGSYSFVASGFTPDDGVSIAPFDPITGSFSVSFDNSQFYSDSSAGLTAALSIPTGTIVFSYSPNVDVFVLGADPTGLLINGTNDFGLVINSFSTQPVFGVFAYSQIGAGTTFRTLNVRNAAVPEPGTLALLGLGLAGLGVSRRRKMS